MANGWWNNSGAIAGCVAAYQPIGAANLAASYSNLFNPGTLDAAPGTAPTFNAATGWTLNGSSQHLVVTGLDVAAKPRTLLARVTFDSAANYRIVFGGTGTASHELYMDKDSLKMSTAKADVVGIATATTALSLSVSYVVAVTYSAAGVWTFYLNGSADGTGTNNQTFTTSDMVLGAQLSGGNYWMSGQIAAMAIYDAELTSGEVATISTAAAALSASSAKGLPIIMHHHHAVFGGG